MTQHPPDSGECADAAREILPIAREIDEAAKPWHIYPTLCDPPELTPPFLSPRGVSERWRHHITVEVTEHYVDALTGVDGHEKQSYLEEYFTYPDALSLERADLEDEEL